MTNESLNVRCEGDLWLLSGTAAPRFGVVNEFLSHLADRNYLPRTQRAYAFDLLAFTRWLDAEDVALAAVDTDVLLRFLTACRETVLPGRPGGNVYSIKDGRSTGYAPATINRRLAAISTLFAFQEMRDPEARNPVPRSRPARGRARGERSGLLAHTAKAKPRSTGPKPGQLRRHLHRGAFLLAVEHLHHMAPRWEPMPAMPTRRHRSDSLRRHHRFRVLLVAPGPGPTDCSVAPSPDFSGSCDASVSVGA